MRGFPERRPVCAMDGEPGSYFGYEGIGFRVDQRWTLSVHYVIDPTADQCRLSAEKMADTEPLDFPLQGSLAGPLWRLANEEARAAFMPVRAGQAASLMRDLPAGQLVETLVAEAQAIMWQKGEVMPDRISEGPRG